MQSLECWERQRCQFADGFRLGASSHSGLASTPRIELGNVNASSSKKSSTSSKLLD